MRCYADSLRCQQSIFLGRSGKDSALSWGNADCQCDATLRAYISQYCRLEGGFYPIGRFLLRRRSNSKLSYEPLEVAAKHGVTCSD